LTNEKNIVIKTFKIVVIQLNELSYKIIYDRVTLYLSLTINRSQLSNIYGK